MDLLCPEAGYFLVFLLSVNGVQQIGIPLPLLETGAKVVRLRQAGQTYSNPNFCTNKAGSAGIGIILKFAQTRRKPNHLPWPCCSTGPHISAGSLSQQQQELLARLLPHVSSPGPCERLPAGKRKGSGKAGLIAGAACVEVVVRSRGITANLVKVVLNFPPARASACCCRHMPVY